MLLLFFLYHLLSLLPFHLYLILSWSTIHPRLSVIALSSKPNLFLSFPSLSLSFCLWRELACGEEALSPAVALLRCFNCDSTPMSCWSLGCFHGVFKGNQWGLTPSSPHTHPHHALTHTHHTAGSSNRRPESTRQTLTPHISLISCQHQTATLQLPGGLPTRLPHTDVSVVAKAFVVPL